MLPALLLQTHEIVILVVVVFVLFGGATQIPKMARALGRAKGEYQVARKDFEKEVTDAERSAASAATSADAEEVRRAAHAMGIPTDGRSTEQLKAEIGRRLA